MNQLQMPSNIIGVDFFITGAEANVKLIQELLNDTDVLRYFERPMEVELFKEHEHPINGNVWRLTAMWKDKPLPVKFDDIVNLLMINRETITGLMKGMKRFIPNLRLKYIGSEFYTLIEEEMAN